MNVKPRWDPGTLRPLVPGAFITRSAVEAVRAELACNDAEARAYIRKFLLRLSEEQCRQRVVYPSGPHAGQHADVYFLVDTEWDPNEQLVWYVKVCVRNNNNLCVDSFHIAEHSPLGAR